MTIVSLYRKSNEKVISKYVVLFWLSNSQMHTFHVRLLIILSLCQQFTDGSAAVPPKTLKFDEMAYGDAMPMAIVPNAQCIPVHAALGEVGQPTIGSKDMHQQPPSPPFNDSKLHQIIFLRPES